MNNHCHICHSRELVSFPAFSSLLQVTSDCRPYPNSGNMAGCSKCGIVQKVVDEEYEEACRKIYESYSLYQQSDGEEQKIFSQASGVGESRSMAVLRALDAKGLIPSKGRLLDVGCGNGGLLRSFNSLRPDWDLWGCELSDRNKDLVESIPGVKGFHVGDITLLDEAFDFMSSLHSLEHIVSPLDFLRELRDKLRPGGMLLIDVPDFQATPFDLVVADHVTHFTMESLERLVAAAGFDIVYSSDSAVPKELIVLAQNSGREAVAIEESPCPVDLVDDSIRWLDAIRLQAEKIAAERPLGVFGTSIAAVWLLTELGDKVTFFVDEDATRTGKPMFDVPVVTTQEAGDSVVVLPFPPKMAKCIAARLEELDAHWVLPPEMGD